MTDRRSRITTLARHEYRAALRSRVLVGLVIVLVVATATSVYIASVDYRSALADYHAYVAAARARDIQRVAPAPIQLLGLLRGAIEYIEIIGAAIAIVLGYLSVARERSSGTLPLLRSRPVTAGELAAGQALGSVQLISTLIGITAAVGVVSLGIVGRDWINGEQALKLLLAYLAAIVYMATFSGLGALLTARTKTPANGLMLALGVWLLVVLVLPQIGDTLDADNQVPGGLFHALTLDKTQEHAVLARFGTYERVRTSIETASLAKHFERFAFAMTEVKAKYRGFSIRHLLDVTHSDVIWVFAFYPALVWLAFARGYRRLFTINEGTNS